MRTGYFTISQGGKVLVDSRNHPLPPGPSNRREAGAWIHPAARDAWNAIMAGRGDDVDRILDAQQSGRAERLRLVEDVGRLERARAALQQAPGNHHAALAVSLSLGLAYQSRIAFDSTKSAAGDDAMRTRVRRATEPRLVSWTGDPDAALWVPARAPVEIEIAAGNGAFSVATKAGMAPPFIQFVRLARKTDFDLGPPALQWSGGAILGFVIPDSMPDVVFLANDLSTAEEAFHIASHEAGHLVQMQQESPRTDDDADRIARQACQLWRNPCATCGVDTSSAAVQDAWLARSQRNYARNQSSWITAATAPRRYKFLDGETR